MEVSLKVTDCKVKFNLGYTGCLLLDALNELFGHTHKAVAQIGINLGAIFNYVRKQLGQRCTETRFHELRPEELLGFWLDHLSGKTEELRPYLCEGLRLIQTYEQH